MVLRYLIEKEFKQLRRNSFLPRLILIFPCVIMLIMPWAATLEIEGLRIAIIDHDHSSSSIRLIHRIEASPYFKLMTLPDTYEKGLENIERLFHDIRNPIQQPHQCGYCKSGRENGQCAA